MKRYFFGGIHPPGNKDLASAAVITTLPAPAIVTVPLVQHIGAPAKPLVNVGDVVARGQKIGDGEGLCVPVHAPVSGRVIAIEDRPHPSGMRPAIVIENDNQNTFKSDLTPHVLEDPLTADALRAIIREAGIVGMGGAAFPTGVKASVPQGAVDTVIVNACECEPYITADDALLQSQPKRVIGGLKLLCRMIGPKRAVIAMEDNKKDAAAAVRAELVGEHEIELLVLPTRYPQGSEKQLIQAVTGRELPSGKLPKDVACAVFNAGTCAAVYRAVCEGMPLMERVVTVTGKAVKKPQNFLVTLGTPFSALIEAAGGLTDDVWKVLSGGPMMGFAQENLDAAVVKATNSILCLSQRDSSAVDDPVCFRCGKCLDVCPMRLQPLYFHRYTQMKNAHTLVRYHILDCIECGCCAYVCPGKVPLVESIRAGKKIAKERIPK